MYFFWLRNLVAYSLQIALIAAAGALLMTLLRIRLPHLRLLCWQVLMVACLVLPAIQPWRTLAGDSSIQGSSGGVSVAASDIRPAAQLALIALGAGVAIRFAMLGLGLARLRRYRRNSRFLPGAFADLQRRMN